MSTTLISQRPARRLSAPVSTTTMFAAMPTTHVDNTNAMYTAWLGGVDENGCISDKNDAKRITPGSLERMLT